MFSFLSNVAPKSEPPKINGVATSTTMQPIVFKTSEANSVDTASNMDKNGNLDEYYGKLKGLNESVAKFIQTHVDSNPFINLQPIFKDYEKYINELESLRVSIKNTTSDTKQSSTDAQSSISNSKLDTVTPFSSVIFKPASQNSSEAIDTATATMNVNKTSGNQFGATQQKHTLSFGSTSPQSQSFSSSITFGITKNDENKSDDNKNTEDNEDEPPKVEFTPVVEEGHVYTTRCKVFVKKDSAYADRGVGNLFLKPIPNSEKFQLIVRADTNLGNLLCNFILSESIPTQRLGKKDVMLVCLPTPDSKPPPVPILLRVKSPEDADDLLAVLEKHKK